MPLFSELGNYLDPTYDDEQDPEAIGPYYRSKLNVDEEVGRRTIQKVQEDVVGPSVGQFFKNLGSNVGEFASGMFAAATFPIRHPVKTGEALLSPIQTAKFLGTAVAENYKQAYTPQEGESIPGMILRRFYEKPFDSLMDASLVAQVASGGAGLAVRGLTSGVRAAAEGAAAADAITIAAGGLGAEAIAARKLLEVGGQMTPELQVAQRAAAATRAIDLFDAVSARARAIDPISIAQAGGAFALKTFAPDALAALRSTQRITDDIAERTAILQAAEAATEQKVQAAFSELNVAERQIIHPYIAGRLNLNRPVGEQLMTHTGEWVPVKGDVIRPDVLERAREAYIPIQQELETLRGTTPEQVAQEFGAKAMGDAKEFLGEAFDPLHENVQQFVVDSVTEALRKNDQYRKLRETGEMRTSLDVAKERSWRREIENAVTQNRFRSIKDAEAGLPRPTETTVEEALAAMGPQGGIYFPHSAEAFTRDQSTIRNILTKMGEASSFRENKFALYRHGILEHQDPVKTLLRAYSFYEKGRTPTQMMYEAAEEAVKRGEASRMPREWNHALDKDVIAGTHQPFEPGRMLTDELVEEEGQALLTRLFEVMEGMDAPPASAMTIDAATAPLGSPRAFAEGGLPGGTTVGNVNFVDLMRGLAEQAEKGPMYRFKTERPRYKLPTSMGHSFAQLEDSMRPATNPLVRTMDNMTQWWNWTNLNVKVTRLVNNIIGDTGFAIMQGVHPFSFKGIQAMVAAGKMIAGRGEEAAKLRRVMELPGIRSGGLQVGLQQATGTVGDVMQKIGSERGRLGQLLTAPARGVGHWGAAMAKANTEVEAAFRAMSLFYEMSPGIMGRTKRMAGAMGETMSLGERIEQLAEMGGEAVMKNPEYRRGLRQVNRYFNDYIRATPLERKVIRRVFPYYKFFKHSAELITRFPFEHPLQGQVARSIGAAAMQDAKDQLESYGLKWDRDVPPQMRDSLPIYRTENPETGEPIVWMYNTKGQNPFSQMNGFMSEQVLQLLNPVVKVALERATGVNLFTRERFRGALSSFTGREVNPRTGAIEDSFNHPTYGEAFLRSFWPYQTVRELVAQGRVPTDTASLLSMATNAPNAWQIDSGTGFPLRKPTVGSGQALLRFVGAVPQPLQPPTKEQRSARKGVVNTQLNTLYQRYPEKREAILAALEATAEDVALEYERAGE